MSTVTATATDNVITVDNENCAIDPVTSVEVVTVSVEPVTLEVTQLFSGVSPVPAGGGSGTVNFDKPAAMDIPAFKAIAVIDDEAYIADNTNSTHVGAVVGVSLTGALLGGSITIAPFSEVANGAWSWANNNLVFFDNTGTLTQTKPVTGFSQTIGSPLSATKLFVSVGIPVNL